MQQSLVQMKPLRGKRDAWESKNVLFSVLKAYKRIRESQETKDEIIIRAFQVIWKQKVS